MTFSKDWNDNNKMKTFIIYTATTLLLFLIVLWLSLNAAVTSPLFPLRRLDEQIILSTKRNPGDHAKYLLMLVNYRMGDLNLVIQQKQHSYFLPASLRFSSAAGKLTDYIKTHNAGQLTPEVRQTFSSDKKTLEKLTKEHQGSTQDWKFITDDINYLSIYLTQLPK